MATVISAENTSLCVKQLLSTLDLDHFAVNAVLESLLLWNCDFLKIL